MSIPLASIPVETENEVVDALNSRFEIIHHMAKAIFACAWADWNDNYADGCPGGVNVMDIMPDMDPDALKAAHALAEQIERETKADLTTILAQAKSQVANLDGYHPCNEEYFGHYCAMQALGHGVGLPELGLDHEWLDVPDIEFTCYDLDPVQYPIPDDDA